LGNRFKKTWLANYYIGRRFIDIIYLPSDYHKVKTHYFLDIGVYPKILCPKTFNEYLQHSKLFWRRRRHTRMADKIECRKYVEKKIGLAYLTRLLWVGDDIRNAMKHELPDSFVIKSNNASGTNLIVYDKNQFDWTAAYVTTQKWLQLDYARHYVEWQYRWIKPKLLIEELLVDEKGSIPLDYKFFCFYGKVKFVQIDFDRFTSHKRAMVDDDFNLLPFGFKFPRYSGEVKKPDNFDEMKNLAEKLADREKFARIDFYDVGKPVFGEITFHPEAGTGKFDPDEWDLRLGSLFLKKPPTIYSP
jgi:hypothetical protein